MRALGRWLVAGWLLVALVLLGLDGRLPVFVAWAGPGSLLTLTAAALVRQQLAPSMLDQPPLPARYRAADDLTVPLAVVVAIAEAEASAGRPAGAAPELRRNHIPRRPPGQGHAGASA